MDGYNGGLARSWTQNSDFSSLGDVASLHNAPPLKSHQFEVDSTSHKEKEIEVRILRRALNLPVQPFTGASSNSNASSHLSNPGLRATMPATLQNVTSRNKTWEVTDSGYSSKTPHQTARSLNALSGTTLLQDLQDGPPHVPVAPNSPPGSICSSGGSFYRGQSLARSLKESLEESESKRLQLLEKMREAHLTIQNQSEKLAAAESEGCYLRGQIKSMSIEQESFQQELDSLTTEKKALESIRSENSRNRQIFQARMNDLDNQLNALNHTHNALQVECQQKSAVLEQTSLTLTFLEEENNRLQLGNENLKKEVSSMRHSVQELAANRERQEEEKSVIYHELEKLKQVHQALVAQHEEKDKKATTSWNLSQELKARQEMMEQEMNQLKLERDIALGKLSVFEEEVHHTQESSAEVHKEKEQLIRSNVEMEQRLQQLEFVNDLLRKESANVKEAFQKSEELNKMLKKEQEKAQRDKAALKSEMGGLKEKARRIKDSYEKEKAKRIQLHEDGEGSSSEAKTSHEQMVAYRDRLRAKCRELQSQVDTLKSEVRKLRKTREEDKELLKLAEAQKEALAKQQSSITRKLEEENKELQQRLQSAGEANQDFNNLKSQHQRILEENGKLRAEQEDRGEMCALLRKEKEDLQKEKEALSLEVSTRQEQTLQEEELEKLHEDLKTIKENVSRIEADKAELLCQVENLQSEQQTWARKASELQMSHAELEVENDELRTAITEKKEADASAAKEIADLKTELKKTQETLESKERLVENQGGELRQQRAQVEKWSEEITKVKKNYSDLVTKSSSRNKQITTLKNVLMERTKENRTLEEMLRIVNEELEQVKQDFQSLQEHCSKDDASMAEWVNIEKANLCTERNILKLRVSELEMEVDRPTNQANRDFLEDSSVLSTIKRERRKSEGSIDRLEMHPTAMRKAWHQLQLDFEKETKRSAQLDYQLQEVLAERDLALGDIEDLRDGMQQLKEAFEEEFERELESQQNAFRQERDVILQEQQEKFRDSMQQMSEAFAKMEKELRKHSQEKVALETRNKNLEYDRDELRGQIEELCKMRAGAVDKSVQVDQFQSPKRKDSRPMPLRKRSSSNTVPIITVEEMLDSPTERVKIKPEDWLT